MARLLVNLGDADWRAFALQPGVNRVGRSPDNDCPIEHPSVSGAHCEIVLGEAGLVIRDLNSTNGTFIEGGPVVEAALALGQTFRLGEVEALCEADEADAVTAPEAAAVVAAPATPPLARPIRVEVAAPGATPPVTCRFHPRSAARWRCPQCARLFCELCVTSRADSQGVHHVCRTCGVECAPVEVTWSAPAPKSFSAQALGAARYPFSGNGPFVLAAGTVFFTLADWAKRVAMYAGPLGLAAVVIVTVFTTGYCFAYLKRIIASSAAGEDGMPGWPDFTEWGSDIIGPFFQLLALMVVSFGPALLVTVWAVNGHPELAWLVWPALALGCVHAPMALLGLAMFDTIGALNPLWVFAAIVKVPGQYAVGCLLVLAVLLLNAGGEFVLERFLPIPLVPQLLTGFLSLCCLTVAMRVLGLLYRLNEQRLAWFRR
jgi:hypothetical protein